MVSMSNFGPLPGQAQARIPTPPRGETIARYETYLEAQRAVDYLSDNHFPVQFVTIVGTGLQMVERVTGRLTYPRVAIAGAASGAWFGLFVGLVLSLFGGTNGALVAGPLFGVAFGILFGVISYALTGGRRDFTSTSQIVAGEYAVLCLAEQAGAARNLLQQLPGGTGSRLDVGGRVSDTRGTPYGSGSYGSGPYGGGSAGSGPYGTSPYGTSPYGNAPHGTNPYDTAPGTTPPTAVMPPSGTDPGAEPAAAPAEPGLTYGEAIERQRRDRLDRERVERERVQREQLERESRP
jgi:hypothetical protein